MKGSLTSKIEQQIQELKNELDVTVKNLMETHQDTCHYKILKTAKYYEDKFLGVFFDLLKESQELDYVFSMQEVEMKIRTKEDVCSFCKTRNGVIVAHDLEGHSSMHLCPRCQNIKE